MPKGFDSAVLCLEERTGKDETERVAAIHTYAVTLPPRGGGSAVKKHCAQCGKSWHGRRDTCPRCGSAQVYEAGGGWEKPVLIGVAVAIVVIAVALFATRTTGYWYDNPTCPPA